MAEAPFPYMRWAKAHLDGTWGPSNLGMSGVRPPSAEEREAWGLPSTSEIGDPLPALKAALAEAAGLTPAHVYVTAGTSHANFIAALTLARGGRLAVEDPAYEALPRLAQAISAEVVPLRRDPARGWRFDPADLDAAAAADVDLFLVTDLHNPSGQRLDDADLEALTQAAAACDAHVLVDEVYQAFDPTPRRTAVHHDPRILTTNSFTKTHGLGDLRCGWIFADPEVITRIEAWDDLVHPQQPPAMLAYATRCLPHAPARLASLREEAEARIEQVDRWVQSTPGVSWVRPVGGITGFLALEAPLDGDRVAARLLEETGIRIVPGSFFQRPDHLRISYQLDEAELARALDALGTVVAEELRA